MNNMNPLSKYTKIEEIYIKLPTNNMVEYTDALDNENIECGVCARSARDELLFNNPEALMNGQAVVKVIENCVPNIKDANKLFVPDVEALLIAIKIATKEKSYEINTHCPECEKEGAFERDLEYLINTMSYLEEKPVLALDSGLVLYFTPITWELHSKMAMDMYKMRQEMKINDSMELDEKEKVRIGNEIFSKIADFQFQSICESILYIELPDENSTKVDDKAFIKEWVSEQPKAILTQIMNQVESMNRIGVSDSMDVSCSECNHEWTIEGIRFDPTSFFTQNFSQANQKK